VNKALGYDPETGDRLVTRNSTDREFGLSASSVVAASDHSSVITGTTLLKTDSLGRIESLNRFIEIDEMK
jgi:hypothetical protein